MAIIDFFAQSEIEIDIRRILTILRCGIFNYEKSGHPLLQSAFIELVIRLKDLLYKSEKYGHRVNFNDDIIILKDEVEDITAAITFVRNALCHIESDKNIADKQKKIISSFNIVFGKGSLMNINGKDFCSDYEDDICFFFGKQKLYLKRHIIRAFEEAKNYLSNLLEEKKGKA